MGADFRRERSGCAGLYVDGMMKIALRRLGCCDISSRWTQSLLEHNLQRIAVLRPNVM